MQFVFQQGQERPNRIELELANVFIASGNEAQSREETRVLSLNQSRVEPKLQTGALVVVVHTPEDFNRLNLGRCRNEGQLVIRIEYGNDIEQSLLHESEIQVIDQVGQADVVLGEGERITVRARRRSADLDVVGRGCGDNDLHELVIKSVAEFAGDLQIERVVRTAGLRVGDLPERRQRPIGCEPQSRQLQRTKGTCLPAFQDQPPIGGVIRHQQIANTGIVERGVDVENEINNRVVCRRRGGQDHDFRGSQTIAGDDKPCILSQDKVGQSRQRRDDLGFFEESICQLVEHSRQVHSLVQLFHAKRKLAGDVRVLTRTNQVLSGFLESSADAPKRFLRFDRRRRSNLEI